MTPKFTLKTRVSQNDAIEIRVYEQPPCCRTLIYNHVEFDTRQLTNERIKRSTHYFRVSMPYLIFVEEYRNKTITEYQVGARNRTFESTTFFPLFSYTPIENENDIFERDPKQTLYLAPFPNVTVEGVCMGNNEGIKDFWNIPFTGDGSHFTVYYQQNDICNNFRTFRTMQNWAAQTTKDKDFGMKHKWLRAVVFKQPLRVVIADIDEQQPFNIIRPVT